MTSQQRGWYIDLLCWAWQEGGIDLDTVRDLCLSRHDVEFCDNFEEQRQSFAEVLRHFSHDCENGLFTHPKLAENRSEASDKSEKATDSANKRWHKKRICDRNAKALLRASNSLSKSLSSSEDLKEKKEDADLIESEEQPVRAEFDDQWQQFRRLYEEIGNPLIEADFTKAHRIWRVMDFGQKTTAIVNLAARKQHHEARYIPKPEKYLLDKEYTRVVMARSNGTSKYLNEEEKAAL